MFWVYTFILIVAFILLAEEAIYFFVNRYVFGKSTIERKWGSWFKQIKGKMKVKRRAS